MGIDRITAMSIINNVDVMEITTYEATKDDGPNKKGKFGGAICWGEHPHHPSMPLLSSACVYDTADEARQALQEVIDQLVAKKDEIFGITT